MSAIQHLITEHLNVWTAADTGPKSGRGRSSANAAKVYGISKLRELILELAVRGKLVPQNASDEPASELLKRIQAEKAKLIAEGKIKKDKPLAAITDEEKPFLLPSGWEWARLNAFVLSITSGGTPSKNNPQFWGGDIPWASVKDLNVEKFLQETQDYITKEGLDNGSKLANKGDLLVCTRMGLGKIAVAGVDVAINQDLKALKMTSNLDVDYFINFYRTLNIAGSGMTVAGIKQDELLSYCVPTPPLPEQHRIVAKVDELMALCDQLEAEHNNATEAHEKLVSHLLGTLTQSQSAEDFSANWQRIATHFDTLFTTEASIDALKQALLQLAVMGKLVPQDPNDEPASELLGRIQVEKAKLVAEGKIKKGRLLAGIADDEKKFELPAGWEWIRKTDIFTFLNGYAFKSEWFKPEGVKLLRNINVSHGFANWDDCACVSEEHAAEFEDFRLSVGDMVLSLDRPIITTGLKFAVISESDIPCLLLQRVAKIVSVADGVSSGYLSIWLNSSFFVGEIDPGRSNGVPHISTTQVANMVFALPPAAEQHRIVAKVDELMTLCDQLKSRLTESSQLQQALANVLIEKAVA